MPDATAPPYRGLALFDLDNTLFDRAAAFRRWVERFVAERSLPADAVDFLLQLDGDGHAPRAEVFGPLVDRFGLAEAPAAIETYYRETYPEEFRPQPEVQAGLRRVRDAGWTVLIVTNGPPNQIEKIRQCGLDVLVDGWCISDVVGSAKPDVGIFRAAAALVTRPLDGWMVGDTIAADVVGGRAAGLRTIWLARGRQRPTDPADTADVTVESIADAFAALVGEESEPRIGASRRMTPGELH